MKFKECVNCEYISCTAYRRCLIDAENKVKNTPENRFFPVFEPPGDDELNKEPEPPCNARYSSNGLCPCCGDEIERTRFMDDPFAMFDECMSCGWESDLLYDL